jgi:ABC-type lipoprotein release transport system permease subunit
MLLQLAWRNVGRNKRRSALTLAAAVFAVVLLVHMIALTTGVHERMIEDNVRMHAGHLQLAGAGYLEDRTLDRFVRWTPELAAAVDATPGIVAAAPRVNGFALLSAGPASEGVALLGIDPAREGRVSTWPARVVRGASCSARGSPRPCGSTSAARWSSRPSPTRSRTPTESSSCAG